MARNGLSNSASKVSQIVPLSDRGLTRKARRLLPVHNISYVDKLLQTQAEMDRLKRDLGYKDSEIRRLLDRCHRKDIRLDDEIEFLETGLEFDAWENRIQMRRRISRLKGARDYKGTEG